MKKAILLLFIFLTIIGAGVTEHYFVHKTFDTFDIKMEEIEKSIDNNDIEKALEQTKELQAWWMEKKHIIEAISYCADARQVNVIIGELQGSLEINDLENASSKIVSLYQLIDNIRDILDFNALDII